MKIWKKMWVGVFFWTQCTLQHYLKMIIVVTLLQKPTCVAANHPSHWRTVVSWWSRAVQVSETVPWPTAPPTYRHNSQQRDHSTDRRQIPIDRWTGFNDILSMQVTAISCLKEFKLFISKANGMYRRDYSIYDKFYGRDLRYHSQKCLYSI